MIDERDNEQSTIKSWTHILLDEWKRRGVGVIFVVPGAQIEPFLIDVFNDDRFQLVNATHEQGAGYMADGYARASGNIGVVMTINGPGATNLLTAAITAKTGNSPVLFLTGDAPTFLREYGAFQSSNVGSSNTLKVFKEALSFCIDVKQPSDIEHVLSVFSVAWDRAIRQPIHLNVPLDMMTSKVEKLALHVFTDNEMTWFDDLPLVLGERIVIYVGEEVYDDADYEAIASFSEAYHIPIAITLAAKNMQPFIRDPLFLGVFGYAGGPRAFAAMLDEQVDTLLIFGAGLNERNTVNWHSNFFHPSRHIIRISQDKLSAHKSPRAITNLNCSARQAIEHLQAVWPAEVDKVSNERLRREQWTEHLQNHKRVPAFRTNGLSLAAVVIELNARLPADALFFLDSGDHRIFGATFWEVRRPQTFFTAAETAPMGWAVAAGIGASFVDKRKQVCVLTGDGCMQMHGMELLVAAKNRCRVLFIVSNNRAYGRIAARLGQQSEALIEALTELPQLDWTSWAQSMGVAAQRVTVIDELKSAVEHALNTNGPFLIELLIEQEQPLPFDQAVFSSSTLLKGGAAYER
jgi:acetolactate synthase-1/2/3 large subunit